MIYVWLEMASGFLAATQELLDRAEDGGQAEHEARRSDERARPVPRPRQWLFSCCPLPRRALRLRPRYLPAFSTSRGHANWGRELLARVSPDVARFYFAWSGPEREQKFHPGRDGRHSGT